MFIIGPALIERCINNKNRPRGSDVAEILLLLNSCTWHISRSVWNGLLLNEKTLFVYDT